MNIKNTNNVGIAIMENSRIFGKSLTKSIKYELNTKANNNINGFDSNEFKNIDNREYVKIGQMDLTISNDSKVFKLSQQIIKAVNKINFTYIINQINVIDLNFNHLFILLENDKEGVLNIRREGSDIHFMQLTNLGDDKVNREFIFNAFSFTSKEFFLTVDGKYKENTEFVIKLLAYLYYGDITTKYILPKSNIKINSFFKLTNNSSLPITYVNTLWKQRINTSGFLVSGHFRIQPYGENRNKRKLIWIDEFSKNGYNRKATRELA